MPGLEDRRRLSHPAPLSSSSASTADSSPPSPAPSPFVRHDELEVILQGRSMEMTRLFGGVYRRFTSLEAGLKRVDDGFKSMKKDMDKNSDEMRKDMKEMRKEMQEMRKNTDNRFNVLDNRFNVLNNGFNVLNNGFNVLNNGRSYRPYHTIHHVSPLNAKTTLGASSSLPGTVGQLWRLKHPEGHDRLTLLIQAYAIDDWPFWRINSFADMDSYEHDLIYDEQSEHMAPYTDIREAVSNHPDLAIESLAHVIGLDYEKINAIMERSAARQRLTSEAMKRQGTPLQQNMLDRQFSLRANLHQQPPRLAATQPRSHHAPSTPDEVVGWDANAIPADRSFKRFQDAYSHDQPRPDAPSPATPCFYVPIRPAETSPSALSPTIPDDDRIDPSTIPDDK